MIPPLSIADHAEDTAAFTQSLGGAFARDGFAVIADHGIADETIVAAFAAARAFFALPEAVKRGYVIPGGAGQRGYTPFGIEAAKGETRADLKEFWHGGRDVGSDALPRNLHVAEVADFDRATAALFAAFDHLGLRLLRAIARYLGLGPTFFDAPVADGNSILRLLHYPPLASGAEGLRAAPHEDINVITLLLGAEEAGLELLGRDGNWHPVDPPPGCVVVNIGDMLQRLTNHVLPSTTHRVVNPPPARAHRPRYAMPFFQHFAPDYLIETLPGCISPTQPNRYPTPITADAYLRERLREIKLL